MLQVAEDKGEVLTGILYMNQGKETLIDMLGMVDEPLATLPVSRTKPSREALEMVMEELR
jgi:2-oxoglutarate ferredoxin oxidoreductase subunit beta